MNITSVCVPQTFRTIVATIARHCHRVSTEIKQKGKLDSEILNAEYMIGAKVDRKIDRKTIQKPDFLKKMKAKPMLK